MNWLSRLSCPHKMDIRFACGLRERLPTRGQDPSRRPTKPLRHFRRSPDLGCENRSSSGATEELNPGAQLTVVASRGPVPRLGTRLEGEAHLLKFLQKKEGSRLSAPATEPPTFLQTGLFSTPKCSHLSSFFAQTQARKTRQSKGHSSQFPP